MLGHAYYHATIRKITALVGTLFNDITIERVSEDGTDEQLIRVPVVYGPREKYLARLEQDPNLKKPSAIHLPIISFEMVGVRYDGERKRATTGRYVTGTTTGDPAKMNKFYNPVPYDLEYEVNVLANDFEDSAKIVEQVLPFFTPAWHATLKMIDEAPDYKTDVYVNLDSLDTRDTYEGDFLTRRAVIWTLRLSVKAFFYGPVTTSKVIKISKVDLRANTAADAPVNVLITTTPGMLANGSPTTDPTLSVDPLTIEQDDDWDYAIKIEEMDI